MILLEARDLKKRFGPEPVLDGVTFEVRPRERIGLIGPNGCGKTTLLKILAGVEEAESGRVSWHPSARFGFLQQHAEVAAGQSVWDIALSGLSELIELGRQCQRAAEELAAARDEAARRRLAARFDSLQHELERRGGYHLDHRVQRVLEGLGMPRETHDRPVEQLSGGQQNRLMLARLLLAETDVLLLDEPSNHLDLEATCWLEEYLAECRQALIIVSHDRFLLDKTTNRTLELFHGTVDSYAGNFSAYWRQKAERLEVQRRTYEKQQELIAKTEDFIRRNHYGQKHLQAEDRRKKLEKIERVAPPREIELDPMAFPAAKRTGDIVLRAEGLAKAYDRPLFSGLTFDVGRGERWGILGPNASGKTTLLRLAMGEAQADEGTLTLGAGVKPGYLDQLTAGLDLESQVVEAVRPQGREFNEQQRRNQLARFGLKGDAVFQTVDSLSGGERSRAGLAKLAAEEANFLILDEPTNHLDIWARDALERALAQFDGTVLLVSHDRYFLNRAVDHIIVVEGNRFRVVEGNYDAYVHLVKRGLAGEQAATGAPPSKDSTLRRNSARPAAEKPTANLRRRRRFVYRKVEDLEVEIVQLESAIEHSQLELAQPEVARDGDRVREIMAQIDGQQEELRRLYEHWDEAVELN